MTDQTLQPEAAAMDLARRCRRLGLLLLTVDADGRLIERAAPTDDPLDRAMAGSNLFADALRRRTAAWRSQDEPAPARLWPGCWAIGLPLAYRRRRFGYRIAVLKGPEMVGTDQFAHLCRVAQLDARLAAGRLRRLPPTGPDEAARWADLLRWMDGDLSRLDRQSAELDNLSLQLGGCYEELSLTYKLSAQMTVTRDVRTFLDETLAELQQVLGLKWIALRLTEHDARLADLSGRVIIADQGGEEASGGGPAFRGRAIVQRLAHELMQRYGDAEPTVVADTAKLGIHDLTDLGRRMLLVPILLEGKPLALLFTGEKRDDGELSSVDCKLATATAQNMSIFLENAMLYEDLQDMFMGTLHSLVHAIDAKDTYTYGHSERVAWLSRSLAKAAGLEALTCERVYLSALVHDIGKIGVPESVLCKPGRLTKQEFDAIKAHPEIGARILSDIRQMQDLIPGVLHHHERYEGGGYPHGLRGERIPLFGRLIALADSFDAMSSDRTYRAAMSLDAVLAEVRRCSGSQFDPALAAVFVELDFAPFYRMLREHRRRRSPLDEAMHAQAAQHI